MGYSREGVRRKDIDLACLRDNLGEIFSKQVFGREVFYQLKSSSNMSHDKFLEVIEKTVRSTLKDDHNINMI